MGGSAGHGNSNGSANAPIVYAQAGQTVKQAVDSLPPMGGVVILGVGTFKSKFIDLTIKPRLRFALS
jgi:hypothetical protein